MKKPVYCLFVAIAFLMITTISSDIAAQGSECCSRHAVLKSCTIDDPMGMMGEDVNVDNLTQPPPSRDSSIIWLDDPSRMTLLGPQETFCSSVQTTLAMILSRDCFHIQDRTMMARGSAFSQQDEWTSTQKTSKPDETEYSFDAEMVSGLDEYTDEGRPVRSRVNVRLYFDGEQRELVREWEVIGTWDTVSNSGTSSLGLSQKLNSSLREEPDIMEVLERFEKRPVECQVRPEKEDVEPGEVITVELSDFTDKFGEKSREFNRLVVYATSGDIMNGEPCDISQDHRIFKVDNGTVKVKYKAPADCDKTEDRITVYNACEILPEDRSPINETQIKDKIAEKDLRIKCYDATLVLEKTYEKTLETSDDGVSFDGACRTNMHEERNLNESIRASVTVSLKLEQSADMPLFNQRWEYYKPMSVNLSGFSYTSIEQYNSTSSTTGSGCATGGHETTVNYNRMAGDYKIANQQQASKVNWIVVFDKESDKAVKIIPAGYGVDYKINEEVTTKGVVHSSDGPDEYHSTESRTLERSFEIGPVGEEKDDPTIKKSDTWLQDYLKDQGVDLPPGVTIPAPSNAEAASKIPPDILVSTGNGMTSFGGRGERTIPVELENGSSVEKLNFSWSMKRIQNR